MPLVASNKDFARLLDRGDQEGFPNSEHWSRRNLTVQIYQILRITLIQTEAVHRLGTTQAQASALLRCRPVSVSVGKPMEFLTTLGQDVEVTLETGARHNAGA